MRTFFLTLLVILLCSIEGVSQYAISNQSKYFNYRNRLSNNFVSVGPDEGQSLPLSRYFCHPNGGNSILHGGEHTFVLGTYIGFLGTEYSLFKKSGTDNSNTIKELFYALEAVNRLDYNAETYNFYNKNPKLDGFFVREDIPDDFGIFKRIDFLRDCPDNGGKYFPGKGTINCVDEFGDSEPIDCMEHVPMSQDHAIRILWGLYLAYYTIDDNLTYGNQQFLDGELYFKEEIKNIFNRIVEKFMADGWIIKDPNRQEVRNCESKTGKIFTFKNNILNAYDKLNNNWRPNLRFPVLARVVANLNGNSWMNGRMFLETKNLSGEKFESWKLAYVHGYETYFINYGIVVHDWEFNEEKMNELKETTEFYLNAAPCTGPFNHSNEDYGRFGWASTDKTERSLKFNYLGIGHVLGNYNGLDFLLLHNLYYLANFESLPQFNFSNGENECNDDCNFINATILAKEIDRVRNQLSKEEKNDKIVQTKIDNIEVNCKFWNYSAMGKGNWSNLAKSRAPIEMLRFGDFDGDGITDVFTTSNGQWKYSRSGKESWRNLAKSGFPLSSLRFGDFDGDGITDVFITSNGQWKYSKSGKESWRNLAKSGFPLSSLRFGDFDGDGITDVFTSSRGRWKYSKSGKESWRNLAKSGFPLKSLRFGDFDGDGTTDVFTSSRGRWKYSKSGKESWRNLAKSGFPVTSLRFGDFDGDGKTDVFISTSGQWKYSSGGLLNWSNLAKSGMPLNKLGFGDFDGDGKTDVFRTD